MSQRWNVHKFGGSSVADEVGYRRVAAIVREATDDGRSAVVVSAMAGVTDTLIGLVDRAGLREFDYAEALTALRRRQCDTAEKLLSAEGARDLKQRLDHDFRDIEDILRAIWLLGAGPDNARDRISGYGEVWSARLLAALLNDEDGTASWIDSREVLVVARGDKKDTPPVVRWDASRAALHAAVVGRTTPIVVLPGYVARSPEGTAATLGRNGSDYSASIFASLLDAESVTIWTDVDGVLSADPRHVPDALVLDRLSYDEAMELAYFGAKVLHPSTMGPAVAQGIPIFIRNSFRPDAAGTRIDGLVADSPPRHPVKGLATVSGMALVNLEGTGMIGVPGVAHRLFGALAESGVSVVLISQGSSEHSICCAIPGTQATIAREAIERAFYAERHFGQIQTLEIHENCAILAAVGDSMAGTPGVAAALFGALGRAGANVRAIAQGSSERNISVVLDEADATRALRAVHAGFYLSNQTLSIGVIGPGVVGAAFLDQVAGQRKRLRDALRIDLRVRGITGSRRMLLDEAGDAPDEWRTRYDRDAVEAELDAFVDHVQTDRLPHAVLVDCTASAEIAERYPSWIERGIHIVTPNKLAGSAPMDQWRRLRSSCAAHRRHWLYEATVGAGLPIIQTLRDLLQTGDEIVRIEGVLSGTLSYLFNAFDGERPFSEIVREARDQGYTEPDPREDLSGMDVARKVVILAREAGMDLDLADLDVASLVPDGLEQGDDFLERLAAHDETMRRKLLDAVEADEVLRFVGVVDPAGGSCVELRRYPRSHPFAGIDLTDNIVQFTTRRYCDNPLVVRGPGAGPDVTASGIFADLLRLAAYTGSP